MPTVTKTFTYSGTLQQATIPAGTTSIDIYLWGGAGGAGGAGAPNAILGSATTYAGGGGAGGGKGAANPGPGGAGGGGAGGQNGPSPQPGTAGTANTGGGGGGAGGGPTLAGANGGSGIVVVRVPGCFVLAGSPCCARTLSTHPGGDKIAKFTASGTLTINGA